VTIYVRLILLLTIILFRPIIGSASIIKIPQDFLVIQDGLDAAESGDTVMVAAGIYSGDGNRDLNFNGKAIALISEGGSDSTILDCGANLEAGNFRGFIFENGEDSSAHVVGFTIKNAGLLSIGHVPSGGAGAYIWNSSPVFENCVFENNVIDPGPKKILTEVAEELSGGAVLCDSNAAPYFQNCVFIGNQVWHGGGAIYCYKSSPVINGCLFIDNFAFRGPGAAILCDSLSFPVIANSTFFGNFVDQGPGSAIACRFGSHSSLSASIIAFNIGTDAIYCDSTSSSDVDCSNLYGNSGGDWAGCVESLNDSSGNMCVDPIFCDTLARDLHLGAASPCAPSNNMCNRFIGALHVACLWGYVCGDASGNEKINLLDITYIIRYLYKGGPPSEPEEAADANGSGNVDLLDITFLVYYLYNAGPPPICPGP